MAALEQLDRLLEQRRKNEQLAEQVPVEVTTEQHQYSNGVVEFRFRHETLSEMGLLRIAPVAFMVPPGMCVIDVELFGDDPDEDPARWNEKYRLLEQMTTLWLAGLPDEKRVGPRLPPLQEAREQRRLYLRFIQCQNSIELFGLVKSLSSEEEYRQLLAVIETALRTIPPADRPGINQRLEELRLSWKDLNA